MLALPTGPFQPAQKRCSPAQSSSPLVSCLPLTHQSPSSRKPCVGFLPHGCSSACFQKSLSSTSGANLGAKLEPPGREEPVLRSEILRQRPCRAEVRPRVVTGNAHPPAVPWEGPAMGGWWTGPWALIGWLSSWSFKLNFFLT